VKHEEVLVALRIIIGLFLTAADPRARWSADVVALPAGTQRPSCPELSRRAGPPAQDVGTQETEVIGQRKLLSVRVPAPRMPHFSCLLHRPHTDHHRGVRELSRNGRDTGDRQWAVIGSPRTCSR